MRILIVEDHLEVLECLRSYFGEQGNEVRVASTAREALEQLERGPCDLALVDLLLPQGSGRQVIREIAGRRDATRVVVVTGCDDLELRRELLELGVADYLFKPVTIRDLDALFTP